MQKLWLPSCWPAISCLVVCKCWTFKVIYFNGLPKPWHIKQSWTKVLLSDDSINKPDPLCMWPISGAIQLTRSEQAWLPHTIFPIIWIIFPFHDQLKGAAVNASSCLINISFPAALLNALFEAGNDMPLITANWRKISLRSKWIRLQYAIILGTYTLSLHQLTLATVTIQSVSEIWHQQMPHTFLGFLLVLSSVSKSLIWNYSAARLFALCNLTYSTLPISGYYRRYF